MTAFWSMILKEILTGGISIVLNVLMVLIPLMILIEFFHVYHVMEKFAKKLTPVTKVLGISPPAVLPLLVATMMGVTYGAGTLIEMGERNPLPRKDFILIAVFFFICHGIIETTAIWATVGANVLVLSAGRLLLAAIFTIVAARLPIFRGPKFAEGQPKE